MSKKQTKDERVVKLMRQYLEDQRRANLTDCCRALDEGNDTECCLAAQNVVTLGKAIAELDATMKYVEENC